VYSYHYDDLGSAQAAAHPDLSKGEGAGADPSFYHTPLHVGATQHCLPFLPAPPPAPAAAPAPAPAPAAVAPAPAAAALTPSPLPLPPLQLRPQPQPPSCTFLSWQQHSQTFFDQALVLHYQVPVAAGVGTSGAPANGERAGMGMIILIEII
jgi:hypothetical protein